jgi:hypothetical protein
VELRRLLSVAADVLDELVAHPGLDEWLAGQPRVVDCVDDAVDAAIGAAYGSTPTDVEAHAFLQRTLYRINRLMLFWFDDLHHYDNDRSPYLHRLRAKIEDAWQTWELSQVPNQRTLAAAVPLALRTRTAEDVDPLPSAGCRYFRDRAPLAAYRRLVAIASLDGLVEASQLSRTLGGVSNAVHGTLTRLLIEEYGGGREARKHSTYFRTMMEGLGMDPTPEAYVDLVPWEVMACINHSFLVSDRRRLFLRYVGGLLHTEMSVPATFRCYLGAAQRLGLPAAATTYWELHIKEDARHGPWMLEEVALPLAARYPADAWEIVLGYDQQRVMSARAGAATAAAAEAAALSARHA